MQCAGSTFLQYNFTGALQHTEVSCSILHHSSIWCGVLQICSAVVVCKILHHHGTWGGLDFSDMFCEEHIFFMRNFGSWIFFLRSKNSVGLAVVRRRSVWPSVVDRCRRSTWTSWTRSTCTFVFFVLRATNDFLYGTWVRGSNPMSYDAIFLSVRGSIPGPNCMYPGP